MEYISKKWFSYIERRSITIGSNGLHGKITKYKIQIFNLILKYSVTIVLILGVVMNIILLKIIYLML